MGTSILFPNPLINAGGLGMRSVAVTADAPFGFAKATFEPVAGTGGPAGPQVPGAFSITAGLLTSVLAPKLFDKYVTQDLLVRNGLLPQGAAPFVNLGGSLGMAELLRAGGLSPVGALGALKMMPLLTGLRLFLDPVAFDLLGVPRDAFTETAVDAASMAPLFFAQQSPLAASLLGLGEGATLLTPGVWVSALGKVKLIDVASGLGVTYGARLYFGLSSDRPDLDTGLWDLSVASVHETVSEELALGKYLPNLAAASVTIVSLWSDYVWKVDAADSMRAKIEAKFDQKMETIRSQADALGKFLDQNLAGAVAQNIRQDPSGGFSVDWDGVRRSVKAFYHSSDNKELGPAYDFVEGNRELLGFKDALTLTALVDRDGNIADLEDFKKYFYVKFALERRELEKDLEAKAWELEVVEEEDGRVRLKTPEAPDGAEGEGGFSAENPDSPEAFYFRQVAFVNGDAAALSRRILLLSILEGLLKTEGDSHAR
ncbi:MAG TPA: hypothetical protein VFX30_14400 [bacterium]|nr:hypothetical protein [bacterium]